MSVGPIQHNRQGKSMLIRQYAPFCAHFFPDRWGYGQPLPWLMALSPYSHPRFATPSRSLPIHHVFPDPVPKFSQKNQLLPILENSGEYCWRIHTFRELLSISTLSAVRRISPPIPFADPEVSFLLLVSFCRPCLDLVVFLELGPLSLPTIHLIWSMIGIPFSPSFSPMTVYHFSLFMDRLLISSCRTLFPREKK